MQPCPIPWPSRKEAFRPGAVTLAFTLLLCCVFVTPVPAAPNSADKPADLTLIMSISPFSSPFVVALEKGYFAESGLNVKVKEVIGGHRAAKALFQGEGDIATSSETIVMRNSFERNDFSVFCTFVTSTNHSKLVTRKDTGIRTVSDLTGKRIGTVTGASAHFFLDELLILNSIDADSVELVHINPESAATVLAEGSVDAVAVWEPWAHLSVQALGDKAVIVPHEKIYIETFNALTTKAFAQARPDLLKKVLRGLLRAVTFIREHPQAAQEMVARRFDKDLSIIQTIWKNFEFDISLDQWLITTLEAEARWAMRRNLVAQSPLPDYLDFLLVAPLKEVAKDKVNLF